MKVLIIGASGLLAKPVIEHLDKSGHELRMFSRNVNAGMFDKPFELVPGDVFNADQLAMAMSGCDAVHISLSTPDEAKAAALITDAAKRNNIRLVSYISGATVCEENRWFPMTDNKFRAEQVIMKSGIPYLVFRPTWFYETLGLMVRDGKASVPGRQEHAAHWVSGEDLGKIVASSFNDKAVYNSVRFVYGPAKWLMKDILREYCREFHPEIKHVSTMPLTFFRVLGLLTRKPELKNVADMFGYFQKVEEPDIANNGNQPEPERLSFGKWVKKQKQSEAIL